MRVDDFDFDLPEDRIALRPAVPRDAARLLQVSDQGEITDHLVSELADFLRPGDVLVLNDTKVFAACLHGTRAARAHGGGGAAKISINLHLRLGPSRWKAFVRPARRLRKGDQIDITSGFHATVIEKSSGGEFTLEFNDSGAALEKKFAQFGEMPLPPYIGTKRAVDARDEYDYQTIFADASGSVAAPTAGLHFTDQMFASLAAKGVHSCFITLHVGAGTFLPVKVDETKDHVMHAEWRQISEQSANMINTAKKEGRRVIAVGTTSLRSLESAIDPSGQISAGCGNTDIFITPGYKFKVVDGLLTNFHLPRSTLFMLVSAFSGLSVMQKAYARAIRSGYRFYSYGDANLLWRKR